MLLETGLFLGKALGLAIIVVVSVAILVSLTRRQEASDRIQLKYRLLNEELQNRAKTLTELGRVDERPWWKRWRAAKADDSKESESKEKQANSARLYVLPFTGDMQASAVEGLREAISAILMSADEDDEVLLTLESSGGAMHAYGLAASQLDRLRQRKLRLSIAVDQVAASGGYMMACVGDRIVCAPFAIIGSIGVVAQLPNFNRLLKRHEIDYEQHTAGEFKRTLTLFGENTDADREKFQSDLDEAHALFKNFIAEHRPDLDLARVATGEYWFGKQALELGLVDELATSDDLLLAACEERQVIEITAERKKSLLEKLSHRASAALSALLQARPGLH